jgi:hypothetical protein
MGKYFHVLPKPRSTFRRDRALHCSMYFKWTFATLV